MGTKLGDIRRSFPILINRPCIYFDNAATTQKPKQVIEVVNKYYEFENANPFRGIYKLSEKATDDYENARQTVSEFIGAEQPCEIVFTRNATESINLVANCLDFSEDDEIVVCIAEHHSNYLPWYATKAKIVMCDINSNGYVTDDILRKAITPKTKLVCINWTSNVFGQVNDIKSLTKIVHDAGALIMVDGTQAVPHMPVDVVDTDIDFLAFSGHKMYAPMGIGVLYGKMELLNSMHPFMYGGEMIDSVHWGNVSYAPLPHKFEAGTVNVSGAVGLEAAIKYISIIGFDFIQKQEKHLTEMAMNKMLEIPHVHIVGSQNPADHNGIISFTVDDVHPHDVASVMNDHNICIRAGHHCAQPLMDYLEIGSCARVSFSFYNTDWEVEQFISCLSEARREMGYDD